VTPRRIDTAAVWDLGSSSFQLLVCALDGDGRLEPVLRRRSLLNLGTAVGATGRIPSERVRAAVAAAKRLRRELDAIRPPDVVVALATAALRDAANGREVVRRLEPAVGVPVRMLDGPEEARLCFIGQRSGTWSGDGLALGVDVGGGSIEVAVGDDRSLLVSQSAAVGATRLAGELQTADPLTAKDRKAIRERTATALEPIRSALRRYPMVTRRAIVSGGTARALGRLAVARSIPARELATARVAQVELPAGQVADLSSRLAAVSLADRLAMPGMPARRARMLPVGAAILDVIAQSLGIERFVVSEWGLREGAIIDACQTASAVAVG
jgi:exopolyphosphatase/guanosine-5'-triphosphate,3'-diphosphate pyrophosphatase